MFRTNAENLAGFITKRAGQRSVALEGPPMFLRPDPSLPAQSWSTRQFIDGWKLLDQIHVGLPGRARNWVLVDDVNNGAQQTRGTEPEEVVARIIAQTPDLQTCGIFANIPWDFKNHRGSWESDILARLQQRYPGLPPGTLLGGVDAYFQGRKLAASLGDCLTASTIGNLRQEQRGETLQELRMRGLPSLIVVHPREFRRQQLGMLTNLLGVMKGGFGGVFLRLTTESRIALIEDTYTHMWVNRDGEVEGVTRPVWNVRRSVFEHQEMPIYE